MEGRLQFAQSDGQLDLFHDSAHPTDDPLKLASPDDSGNKPSPSP